MTIVYILIVIFIIMGVALLFGKGDWLIAGYNTMSKEEKEKFDKRKLCKAVGSEMLFVAFIMAVTAYVDTDQFASYTIIPILISVGILIWFANSKCQKK